MCRGACARRGWLFKGLTARDFPTIPFSPTSFSPADIDTNTWGDGEGGASLPQLDERLIYENESVIYETLLDEGNLLNGTSQFRR